MDMDNTINNTNLSTPIITSTTTIPTSTITMYNFSTNSTMMVATNDSSLLDTSPQYIGNNNNNTSNATINTTTLDDDDNIFDDDNGDDELLRNAMAFAHMMNTYYMPIICATGSLGNILSIFVFFKTKLRKLSSSFYLAALAVSDTCYLIILFFSWLSFFNINFYNRGYMCQFFTYMSNLACFCSVWFVVAFTVERFIAVMYPLRRQTMCTVRRAKMVLVGLTLAGCLHCLPFMLFSETVMAPNVGDTICDIKKDYGDVVMLFNLWDTVIVLIVPFTTIAILNTYTACTVWKFATVRRTLTMQKMKTQSTSSMLNSGTGVGTGGNGQYRISSLKRQKSTTTHPAGQHNVISRQQSKQQHEQPIQQHATTNCNHHNNQPNHHNHLHHNNQHNHHLQHCEITQKSGRRKLANSSQLKVTKMLLLVSTVFVCLNLPSFYLRIKVLFETQSAKTNMRTVALQYIFNPLYVTNFGINFVLYCVSGQNFRKAVWSIFQRVSADKREGLTQVTVSEYCRNTGTSTRRRMMTQHCWNEMHELHPLK